MRDAQRVTLEALARGAVGERWDVTLARLIENMRDPNTDATAVRRISLEMTVRPGEDRETAAVKFDVKLTAPNIKAYQLGMFLERADDGELVLTMRKPQREIDDELAATDRAVAGTINPEKKAGAQ